MANPRMSCFRFSPIAIGLWLLLAQLISADITLQMSLYTDRFCKYPAPINKNFSVSLNTCVSTPGAFGFAGPNVVCDDGNPVRYNIYRRTACSGSSNTEEYSNLFDGCHESNNNPIPGFVAFCGDESQLSITSTTSFPAATNLISASSGTATSDATSTSDSESATNTSESSTTSSSSSSSPTPSSSSSSTTTSFQFAGPTDTPTSSNHANPTGWRGLSNGEKFGAIMAVAMGLPAVL